MPNSRRRDCLSAALPPHLVGVSTGDVEGASAKYESCRWLMPMLPSICPPSLPGFGGRSNKGERDGSAISRDSQNSIRRREEEKSRKTRRAERKRRELSNWRCRQRAVQAATRRAAIGWQAARPARAGRRRRSGCRADSSRWPTAEGPRGKGGVLATEGSGNTRRKAVP